MAQNLSKKFSSLICCLMTMQALRLVISTAGFCAVRFHIDCSLFNIFISRLVNAVMMAQLFGNWLGDLIVFALSGQAKLWAASLAFWAEFLCFCSALISICHSECGHLNGFYWSMVIAYFWWKVGEAPCTSVASPESIDYYYAGFTLSGVWASCLKGLVMRCVADGANTLHFNSDTLGEVNVKVVGGANVVGRRSVKTTVDYRAASWLYVITIVLTFLMCVDWTVIAALVKKVTTEQKTPSPDGTWSDNEKKQWDEGVGGGTGKTNWNQSKAGKVTKQDQTIVSWIAGIAFGAVLAVPGAMFGLGVGWVFGKCCCFGQKTCQLIFGIVGAVGGMAAGVTPCRWAEAWDTAATNMGWVVPQKWCAPYAKKNTTDAAGKTKYEDEWEPNGASATDKTEEVLKQLAPMMGLVAGLVTGAITGLCIGCCTDSKKRGFCAGAFLGSFFGLITGECVNAGKTWQPIKEEVAVLGFLIVVLGLGTVYSIYPGMAPCSITQFKYFNIIDILILILSSIAPLVIMGLDLGNAPGKLGATIFGSDQVAMGAWVFFGAVFVLTTLVCEILVLTIMQHPFSDIALDVTTSGWRAVLLTVTMVTSQLTSSSIGFGCMAAGGGFNDGFNNANSTLTLWTIECTGVLGEGYLTELKKYEPGKWPTQGMGRWATYKWWNRKAFGNAWAIWCCIGTTDLRRDIMLCRQ